MTTFLLCLKPFARLALAAGLCALTTLAAPAQTAVTVAPDATFGAAGTVSTRVLGVGGTFSNSSTNTPTMYSNLRQMLVAGGYIWACGPIPGSTGFVVKRYLPDGTPDTAFGTNGVVTTAFSGTAEANGLALQPDGKLVVVGRMLRSPNNTFAAARYLPTGALDSSFGTNGLLEGNVSSSFPAELRRVAVLPGGNLLLVGTPGGGPGPVTYTIRLTAGGQFDTSFGSGGVVSYSGYFQEMKQLTDGRVLVAGTVSNGSFVSQVSLLRLTAAGLLDSSFGTNGQVLVNGTKVYMGQTLAADTEAYGIGVQPADGKIVLVGRVVAGTLGARPVLLRLEANGTPDATFNTTAANSLSYVGGLLAAEPQSDGTILVSGSVSPYPSYTPQLFFARYGATGALDNTFNNGGYYLQPAASAQITAVALAVPAADQLLAWSGFEQLSGQTQTQGMRLSRYRLTRTTAVRPAADAALQLQAAPVPAAGSVQLRYTLPAAAAVRLTLHDQLGRTVATPVPAATRPAGSQELGLDVSELANGLYFCTLQAGALAQTIRLAVQH